MNSQAILGEALAVVIVWGIPAWLVFRAWRKFWQLNHVSFSLRIAMLSLLVSEGMLLLLGVGVAVESTSAARMPGSLQTVGLINIPFCLIAFFSPLAAITHDTDRARKAMTAASIYLMFIWLYALVAH